MPTSLVVSSVYSGSITLTWNSVPTASSYNIYRANTQTGAEAKINTSPVTSTSYTDNVPAGASYYYKVVGVNNSGDSPKSAGAFAYAAAHYSLLYYTNTQILSLTGRTTHYYRMEVTQGASYTIEWQNGNNQNISYSMYVDAYQNNGTSIFSDAYNGYSGPRVFNATSTGFVTVRVRSNSDSSQNYQIYYY
jgi:fibronectin type 3 domain-containing protein